MKKLTGIIFATLLTISGFAQQSNYKVFPFKSGIIQYEQSGNAKGTHTKYIDDFGYKQADYAETVTKVFGFSTKENSGVILIGPKVYTIDYKNNSATVGENPVYSTYANSEVADYDELGKQAMASLGFENTGVEESILGKSCEVWEGGLGKIWIWKGLALKSKTTVLGITITETATKIDISTSVPSEKFEIPKGIEVEEIEMPEGMEEMFEDGSEQMSSEDKKAMQDVANMSYDDFREMVLKEDPEMSEEEIKQVYDMTKNMSNFLK